MSEDKQIKDTLFSERPNWEDYFSMKLGFKITLATAGILFCDLKQIMKDTVWSNVTPVYPELKPVSIEQICEVEKYLFGYCRHNTEFNFSKQQKDFMTGTPTLFARQQGATLAFAVLLLLQKGQPLYVESHPNSLKFSREGAILHHYTDNDTSVKSRQYFTRFVLDLYSSISRSGGKDLLREVLVVESLNKIWKYL